MVLCPDGLNYSKPVVRLESRPRHIEARKVSLESEKKKGAWIRAANMGMLVLTSWPWQVEGQRAASLLQGRAVGNWAPVIKQPNGPIHPVTSTIAEACISAPSSPPARPLRRGD